jgi:hypothetical protein
VLSDGLETHTPGFGAKGIGFANLLDAVIIPVLAVV